MVWRSGTWETQSVERNERWVKNGCKCGQVLESLRNVLSAVGGANVLHAPHTPQKTIPRRSHAWWYGARRDFQAPIGSRVARSASPFGRLVPTLIALNSSIAPHWPKGCSSSLSTAPRVFFNAGPLCNIRRCLLSHKHFPSVLVFGQHGGARRGSTLPFVEAAGSTTLCTALDVTCSQPSFGHMARNV